MHSEDLSWDDLLAKKLPPPFTPKVKGDNDTSRPDRPRARSPSSIGVRDGATDPLAVWTSRYAMACVRLSHRYTFSEQEQRLTEPAFFVRRGARGKQQL